MGNKEDWEDEYEDLMDSLRTEQHSSVKEREQALSERERKVQQWEEAQREAAKNHGFYGVAQIEEHNYRNRSFLTLEVLFVTFSQILTV